jgi:hypothetical protein
MSDEPSDDYSDVPEYMLNLQRKQNRYNTMKYSVKMRVNECKAALAEHAACGMRHAARGTRGWWDDVAQAAG